MGTYVAFCDISSYVSCSKVFTSRYGRGFGLLEHVVGQHHWLNQPNSVFGIIFYLLHIILAFSRSLTASSMQIFTAVIANFGSVYLAYILYFILKDMCVVCVSMYIVNFSLLLVVLFRRTKLISLLTVHRSQKKTN